MARARNIKPGFFDDEQLAETGPYGMLVFAGLWTLADREGRLEDRPRRIQARILPYFNEDVEPLMRALAERGFIIRYEVDGQRYIQVTNFCRHQTPHVKEAASTIPAPCLHHTSTVQTDETPHETVAPDKHGANTVLAPPDSLNRIPDSLIADTGFSESITGAPAALEKEPYTADFETFWRGYGPTDGPKRPAFTAWKRLGAKDRAAAMAALPTWHASRKWREGFKPYPQKYLSQRFWETVPDTGPARASPNGAGPPKRASAYDILAVPTNDEGTLKW